MRFPLAGGVIALAAVSVALGVPASQAQSDIVYRWADEEGSVHFTQGLGSVPERFRSSAIPLGSVGEGMAPPVAAKEAPAPPPPPTAPPSARRGGQLKPPPPNAPERAILDEAYSNARTADQYLAVGKAYLRFGLPLAAKSATDKAALVAITSADWARVADAYDEIGQSQASSDARRKSAQLLQEEQARGRLPR